MTTIKWSDLILLINEKEAYNVKFFSSIESLESICKLITAYSNLEGGKIIIGFDSLNLHIKGVEISKEDFTSYLDKNIRPKVNLILNTIEKNNKLIFCLKIKRNAQRPCFYKNLCYVIDPKSSSPRLAILENKLQKVKESNNDVFPEIVQENIQKIRSRKKDLNKRQLHALNFLRKKEEIKNKTYRDICKVSHKTAHLELIDLVSKGYIEQIGSGRSTKYILVKKESPVLV